MTASTRPRGKCPARSRSEGASALRCRGRTRPVGRRRPWIDGRSASRAPGADHGAVVPSPATRWVTRPSVWAQISGPVRGLVGGEIGRIVVLVGVEVALGMVRRPFARGADRAVRAVVGIAVDRRRRRRWRGCACARRRRCPARPARPGSRARRRAWRRRSRCCRRWRRAGPALRRQLTVRQGVADDAQRRPVLDRTAGVDPFRLQPQLDRRRQPGGEPAQPQERRVADAIDERLTGGGRHELGVSGHRGLPSRRSFLCALVNLVNNVSPAPCRCQGDMRTGAGAQPRSPMRRVIDPNAHDAWYFWYAMRVKVD